MKRTAVAATAIALAGGIGYLVYESRREPAAPIASEVPNERVPTSRRARGETPKLIERPGNEPQPQPSEQRGGEARMAPPGDRTDPSTAVRGDARAMAHAERQPARTGEAAIRAPAERSGSGFDPAAALQDRSQQARLNATLERAACGSPELRTHYAQATEDERARLRARCEKVGVKLAAP